MAPRIRSLKPELPADEKLGACSIPARYLFVMLITQADDDGRMRGNPAFVRAHCLPYDDVTLQQVDDWLDELSAGGFLTRYTVESERYVALNAWHRNQRIDKPRASQIPDASRGFVEASKNGRGAVADASETDMEGEGERDREKEDHLVAPTRPSEVEIVFDAWQRSTGRTRTHLDDKRRRLIRTALASYPVEDVIAAVDGWRHSPHHRGENDRQTVYNDLSLLLRNGENIERFRDYTLGVLDGATARDTSRLAALERLNQPTRKELTDGTSEVG